MQYIKAPFNFVPISFQVFFPDWADQISHDVPFSNGLSGRLTIEVKAETPVFIGDSNDKSRFCHVGENGSKRFFIPGTSLKGTIRSVLEILSFAKMDQINDHKYAIRDIQNPGVYNLITDSINIHCGWFQLKKDIGGIESGAILDCGRPWRISHQQIDAKLKTNFVNTFRRGGTARFRKTAEFKYDECKRLGVSLDHKFVKTGTVYNQQRCNFGSGGDLGTIVLTGQPGPRGKFYEFVFMEPKKQATIEVDAKTWGEFKFHYLDHDDQHISADWKSRKDQLKSGFEIPVFFRSDNANPATVKDLGLSYLYKMPYKFSVKDLLDEDHRLGFFKPDLAECMFGSIDDDDALKGRVQFSPAWADMPTAHEGRPIETILGTPKASYYPIYIKQKGENGRVERADDGKPVYKTYMDSDAELAGWKRYPSRDSEVNTLPAGTENMGVKFTPLERGVVFIGTINYFNLRPIELGALFSALTFHNNASECYHGLGMAKPYGFGRVALTIKHGVDESFLKKYLREFESCISAYLKVADPDFDWSESDQVKQFIALAKVQKFLDDRDQIEYARHLQYMHLPDFAKAKNKENGFYLENYTEFIPEQNAIATYVDKDLIEKNTIWAVVQKNKLIEEKISWKSHDENCIKEPNNNELQNIFELQEKERLAAENDRLIKMRKIEEDEQKQLAALNLIQLKFEEEQKKKKQEELARLTEKAIQLKDAGLAPIIERLDDFEKAKKLIDTYMKHIGVHILDEKDTSALLKKTSIWYLNTSPKQREKQWKPNQGPYWVKIASFIGPDLALNCYNDLISSR